MLHHVDVHVRDIAATRALLDGLAKYIGYRQLVNEPNFVGYETAVHGRPRIGLILDPDHRAGSTRLAFAVATRQQVDEVARIARDQNSQTIEGASVHSEYGDYYAVFFEDGDGNKFEVVADAESLPS